MGKGYHHVIMHGDVHPHQILAIHEGWHGAARYMLADDPTLRRYQSVKDRDRSGLRALPAGLACPGTPRGREGSDPVTRRTWPTGRPRGRPEPTSPAPCRDGYPAGQAAAMPGRAGRPARTARAAQPQA